LANQTVASTGSTTDSFMRRAQHQARVVQIDHDGVLVRVTTESPHWKKMALPRSVGLMQSGYTNTAVAGFSR
jgi:hypothetical protein